MDIKVGTSMQNLLSLQEQIKSWRNLFIRVNADCMPEDQLSLDQADTYIEQIWNLSNEGDISRAACWAIALSL